MQKASSTAMDAEERLKLLLEGDPNAIDPERPLEEQTQHLLYDNRWEFSRNQLQLGINNYIIMNASIMFECALVVCRKGIGVGGLWSSGQSRGDRIEIGRTGDDGGR